MYGCINLKPQVKEIRREPLPCKLVMYTRQILEHRGASLMTVVGASREVYTILFSYAVSLLYPSRGNKMLMEELIRFSLRRDANGHTNQIIEHQ